jgi:serine/threonine protein kinase
LGEGSFGKVCIAWRADNPSEIRACKIIPNHVLDSNSKLTINLQNEIGILKGLKSDNLIRLLALQKDENNIYQFFEACNGGDLNQLIILRGRISEQEGRLIL